MRLLVLTPEFETWGGGIATFYRDLLPRLATLGHSVRVVEGSAFAAEDDAQRREIDGVFLERLERRRLSDWFGKLSHLASTPGFRRHLAASYAMWEQACEGPDFDIVEATDWGMLFLPPILGASHPTVVQGHASCGQISSFDGVAGEDVSDAMLRLLEKTLLADATQIQTSSSQNAKFWAAETCRDVRTARPAWTPPSRPPADRISDRGLVVGRVQSWKGPDTLCAALQLLGPRAPSVDWIGREVNWENTRRGACAVLSERFPTVWGSLVRHQAPLPPREISARQSSAAFNLVPSKWDVFNFTAVEALASGRPTIVSSGAGASELVEHGVNGYVFDPKDSPALAACIEAVLSLSTAQQSEMAGNAAETVRKELNPDLITHERIELYEQAMRAPSHTLRKASAWVYDICSPKKSPQAEDAFLEHLPLRMLARHTIGRVLRGRGRR